MGVLSSWKAWRWVGVGSARVGTRGVLGSVPFYRLEAYSWRVRELLAHRHWPVAFRRRGGRRGWSRPGGVCLLASRSAGTVGGRWYWRACQGSEPTG